MIRTQTGRWSKGFLLAHVAWWLALGLWSYALVSPLPPKLGAAVIPSDWAFFASKSLHLTSFAFLAATAGVVAPGGWHRLALWLLLGLHAALTEYCQTFVPGRFGCVQDVCINLTGIMLGVALVLGWRLRNGSRQEARPFSATTTAT